MTSSRGQIGPKNVLAADSIALAGNHAGSDNAVTHAVAPRDGCSIDASELEEELQSYELLYKKMMNLFKEILLMFLVCIIYSVLSHDPPKITRSPVALPFFARNSLVEDWYRGDVWAAMSATATSDIGFVMFYAPWDAESQEVRKEFESAAEFMQGFVKFSAVNCWQPGSECRRKYSKVFKWPVLLAYTVNGRAIQYYGPKVAVHMIKFLNNIMNPFKRVNSSAEVMEMLVEHDMVVVADVDCRPDSESFQAAYNLALKLLERDSLNQIGFAISTNSGLQEPSLKLYMWNETLIYPETNAFRSRAMVNWIARHLHQVTMWLAPSGTKSQQLDSYMHGPTLILFTPQNPMVNEMDYYMLLKQAALEYFACNDTIPLLAGELIRARRQRLRESFTETITRCKLATERHHQPTISYAAFQNASHACNKELQCGVSTYQTCYERWQHRQRYPHHQLAEDCEPETLAATGPFATSLHSIAYDKYATSQLLAMHTDWQCRLSQLATRYHPVYFSAEPQHPRLDMHGLSCANNLSLSFFAMDSLLYHHFAENLGVDVLHAHRKTALVLVNPDDESHVVYDGPVTDAHFREFIINYTMKNNLPRAQIDSMQEFEYTHRYKAAGCASGDLCVPDLSSADFEPTIMNPSRFVVVLYHSLQCAFCGGVSHVFLQAARVLANVTSVQFVRIDGDRNTLPWEYTMETYPAILFIPAVRKSESRVYPDVISITVPNLLSFVMANLPSTLRLQTMWEICNDSHYASDESDCVAVVRRENLLEIESTLREWRLAAPVDRPRIMRKLKLLKTIHLKLAVGTATRWRRQTYDVRGDLEKLSRTSMRGVVAQFVGNTWRGYL